MTSHMIICTGCGIETFYHQGGLCRESKKDGGNNCYDRMMRKKRIAAKNMKKSYDGSLVK
jgi:hypothetical protein